MQKLHTILTKAMVLASNDLDWYWCWSVVGIHVSHFHILKDVAQGGGSKVMLLIYTVLK